MPPARASATARERPRRDRTSEPASRSGCAATRSWSTSSCTSRSSSSSCSASTRPSARSPNWQGFSLKWYGRVLADRQIQNALFNSLIVASCTADHLDDRRDDGRARPAASAALVPRPVRRADLRQHHRPRDRHRPGDARLLLDLVRRPRARSSGSSSGSAIRRSSPPTACSTSASSACSSRPGSTAWTGPTSRRATTCTGRRGGRSGRSRSRSCCRRSWPGSC